MSETLQPGEESQVKQLRRMVGEVGTDTYTDEELWEKITLYRGNLNKTAAAVWLEKASTINFSEAVSSYTVGAESYRKVAPGAYFDYCMRMHDLYSSKSNSSRILQAKTEIGFEVVRTDRSFDISRLTQDHMGW